MVHRLRGAHLAGAFIISFLGSIAIAHGPTEKEIAQKAAVSATIKSLSIKSRDHEFQGTDIYNAQEILESKKHAFKESEDALQSLRQEVVDLETQLTSTSLALETAYSSWPELRNLSDDKLREMKSSYHALYERAYTYDSHYYMQLRVSSEFLKLSSFIVPLERKEHIEYVLPRKLEALALGEENYIVGSKKLKHFIDNHPPNLALFFEKKIEFLEQEIFKLENGSGGLNSCSNSEDTKIAHEAVFLLKHQLQVFRSLNQIGIEENKKAGLSSHSPPGHAIHLDQPVHRFSSSEALYQLFHGAVSRDQLDAEQVFQYVLSKYGEKSEFPLVTEKFQPYLKVQLTQMFNVERAFLNWTPFYSASKSNISALHDLYSNFFDLLALRRSGSPYDMRGNWKADKTFNIEDLKKIGFHNDDHHLDFINHGFLVSNLDADDSGESSLAYWFENRNIRQPVGAVRSFVQALGMTTSSAEKYQKRFDDLVKSDLPKSARLTQILVHPDRVDEVAYVSKSMGMPVELSVDGKKTSSPSKILPLLRDTPEKLRQMLVDQSVDHKYRYAHYTPDQLQARLIVDPKLLGNSETIKIFSYYWPPIEHRAMKRYHQKLDQLVTELATEWMQLKRSDQGCLQASDDSSSSNPRGECDLIRQFEAAVSRAHVEK